MEVVLSVRGAESTGMMCDLDKTVRRSCILQSTLITERPDSTCMVVSYHLSSGDIQLTLYLTMNGVPYRTYTLPANETAKWVSDVGSFNGFELTASRHLTSTEDHTYALMSSVEFLPCSDKTGTLSQLFDFFNSEDLIRRYQVIWIGYA